MPTRESTHGVRAGSCTQPLLTKCGYVSSSPHHPHVYHTEVFICIEQQQASPATTGQGQREVRAPPNNNEV